MNQIGTKVYIASTMELEDDALFKSLYQTVSEERQKKIDRLRFQKDKRLSLAAAVLLQKALEWNGIYQYEIKISENGKPYLEGIDVLKFNLSHSEERVMCVLSTEEAGCDVEYIKKTDFKIAEYFLTEEERAMLDTWKTEEEKQDLFYRLWTLKESFIKANGLGMRIPMKEFRFSFEGDKILIQQNVNQEQYYFKEYDLKDGYKYAVCSLNPKFDEIVKVRLGKNERIS